jgi:hypothetical protein
MNNMNNGLITKIWGPELWTSLHCITFGYPISPSDQQKEYYKTFFTTLGHVLPCKYCRDSYNQFIIESNAKITDDIFKDRESLTRWLFLLHEEVNKKLDVNYGISYDDVVSRYESYRAVCSNHAKEKGCVMPYNKKAESYKIASIKDSWIMTLPAVEFFIPYAKDRNVKERHFYFYNYYIKNKDTIKNNDIKCDEWCKRNTECELIKQKMKINGFLSIETTDDKWKGLPTLYELKLILRFTSNLDNHELNNIIDKLILRYNQTISSNGDYKKYKCHKPIKKS